MEESRRVARSVASPTVIPAKAGIQEGRVDRRPAPLAQASCAGRFRGGDIDCVGRTAEPYQTMWRHLRLLSHENNARSLLLGGLGSKRAQCPPPSPALESKARQLAYCILQASEYYQAAEAVTIRTSPLLYFYGMLSLAKALVVANEPDTLLNDIKYHGLIDDKDNISTAIEDRSAVSRGGVFAHLTQMVQGFQYPDGSTFTFRNVLSILPELSPMYLRYFERPSRCIHMISEKVLSHDPYRIELRVFAPEAVHPNYVRDRIPMLGDDFEYQPPPLGPAFVSKENVKEFPDYLGTYRGPTGGHYLIGPFPFCCNGPQRGRYLLPPLGDYVAMFILSDCARYKQDLWGEVVQGRSTGILGLIELFLAVSRRQFPNFVLDELFGERFYYGSVTRIMGGADFYD